MTRRLIVAFLFLMFFTSSAAPKWDPKDKQYLENEFRALQEQIQALKTQLDSLTTQMAELRQSQTQVQAVLIRQQRTLQDMDQVVSSLRLSHAESITSLKESLSQLRTEQEKALAALTGKPAEPGAGASEAPARPSAPPPMPVTMGYITIVEGNTVTVDLGSAQGIQPGTRLAVYKAADPSTRVGVLEVTQVLDAGNSRARILTMNTGVRPEFSDIVRLE